MLIVFLSLFWFGMCNFPTKDYAIGNGLTVRLGSSTDNVTYPEGNLCVKGVFLHGVNVFEETAFAVITTTAGAKILPKAVDDFEKERLSINYYDSDIIVEMTVTFGDGNLCIRIYSAIPYVDISHIQLLTAKHVQSKEDPEWHWSATPPTKDSIFAQIIASTNQTVCSLSGEGKSRTYFCYIHKEFGLEDGGSCLVVAPKAHFYDYQKKLIEQFELPLLTYANGDWFRSKPDRRTELWSRYDEEYSILLNEIVPLARFHIFIFAQPYKLGTYSEMSERWSSTDEFYKSVATLQDNVIENTEIGLWNIFGRLDEEDPLFTDRKASAVWKYMVAELTTSLVKGVTTVAIDKTLSKDPQYLWLTQFNHFRPGQSISYTFIIEDEMLFCSGLDSETITCSRGEHGTADIDHLTGTKVYFAPYNGEYGIYKGYYINNEDPVIQKIGQDGWKDMINPFVDDITAVFADSHMLPYGKEYSTELGYMTYDWTYCARLYLDEIPNLESFEGMFPSYYFYSQRYITFTTISFRIIEYLKRYGHEVYSRSPYDGDHFNMIGTFGITVETSFNDFESTSFETIDYVFSKALCSRLPVVFEFSNTGSYEGSEESLKDIFKRIGQWNELIEYDMEEDVLRNEELRNECRKFDSEPLRILDDLKLQEEQVDELQCIISTEDPHCEIVVQNSFKEQFLFFEVAANGMGYDTTSSKNIEITDFALASKFTVTGSPSVVCTLNDNGDFEIDNQGKGPGYCKIAFNDPNVNIKAHRMLDLNLIGDNGEATVLLHLDSTVHENRGHGYRDYEFFVDFNGEKDIVINPLADSVIDMSTPVINSSSIVLPISYTSRFVDFTMENVHFDIFVAIKGGAKSHIVFKKLLGMVETGLNLFNPQITHGSTTIMFEETLNHEDNFMLRFNGEEGEYSLYDKTMKLLQTKNKEDTITISPGMNTLRFSGQITSDNKCYMKIKVAVLGEVIHTHIPPTPPPNPATNYGWIAGIVIPVAFILCVIIFFVVVVILFLVFRARKGKKKEEEQEPEIESKEEDQEIEKKEVDEDGEAEVEKKEDSPEPVERVIRKSETDEDETSDTFTTDKGQYTTDEDEKRDDSENDEKPEVLFEKEVFKEKMEDKKKEDKEEEKKGEEEKGEEEKGEDAKI